jgi:hypothetical protein
MKHIYLFNNASSKAYLFGIGSSIRQLCRMKNYGFAMHVVHLNADVLEVTVEIEEEIEIIKFPKPITIPEKQINNENYHTSIIRILRNYIDTSVCNIFHLNYLNTIALAKSIKRYLGGKTVLSIRFSQSLFDLKGNIAEFHKIIQSPVNEDDPPIYATVRDEIRNVSEMIDLYVDKVISIAQHSFLQNNKIYKISEGKNVMIYNSLKDEFYSDLNNSTRLKKELGIDCKEKISSMPAD